MKSNPSRLTSAHEVLVIDASVAINLLGTGRAADLLRLVHQRVLMDEFAIAEVTSDPFSKRPGSESMQLLISSGLLSSVQLSDQAFAEFLELTGATPPDDLGDGEAATIAQSFDLGAVPVIDERKATRIALSRRPNHPLLNTIDILACPTLVKAFSRHELGEIFYSALFHARMRVPLEYRQWMHTLIGPERSKRCPNLGPFKS